MISKIINRLKRPEYTGDRRCGPCTVINVGVATASSVVVGQRSRLGGVLTFASSMTLIYLRGYLVPGTPTLTKRYLPTQVLQLFGKATDIPPRREGLGANSSSNMSKHEKQQTKHQSPDNESISLAARQAEVAPEEYFLSLNVLEPCAGDKDDLCLTKAFKAEWTEAMTDQIKEGPSADQAVDMFAFDEINGEYAFEDHGDAWILYADGTMAGQWPSQTALIADLAAATILKQRDPQWVARSSQNKGQLLNGLRLFLDECPNSGGNVEFKEHTVESCCQSQNVLAAVCTESGERLFEHPIDDITQ